MNDDVNASSQKLGVFIDESVDSGTLNWIQSLSKDALVRQAAIDFNKNDVELKNLVNRILTGEIDVAVFMTAAGFEQFFERCSKTIDRKRLLNSLADIQTVSVGSLVTNKLIEVGIQPSIRVAEDIGWRDLLVNLDHQCPVANLNVALESTIDIHSTAAGLEARGATVYRINPIEFSQHDPSSSEQDILDSIEDGDVGTLLFPNSVCASRYAALIGQRERPTLSKNAEDLVIMALGEETEQTLNQCGIECDVVLSRNQLESEIKQSMVAVRMGRDRQSQQLSGPGSSAMDENAPWFNSPFMKAIRREPVDVTPVWMMRQAGRYMQEYREVREKTPFLDLCRNPQLCSEVMCTAVNRLGVDAAIIFSDLLPILVPMGFDLEFLKGDGPVIHNPIRTNSDVDRVKPLENNDELQFVMDTVKQTRMDLPADMPLIGFAGAPFSLASYLIEGGSTKNYALTKQLMYSDTVAWRELMSRLTSSITIYLKGQIEAGAQCVQLFDSWAGCLGVNEYRTYSLPYVSEIISQISPLAPVINFATGNPALLPELAMTSAQVIGIDWRIPLDRAWKTVGYDRAVQGNMDPTVLLSGPKQIREKVETVLGQASGRPGHIFNLGHGILPQTPVDNAIALVDMVHEISSRDLA